MKHFSKFTWKDAKIFKWYFNYLEKHQIYQYIIFFKQHCDKKNNRCGTVWHKPSLYTYKDALSCKVYVA